MPNDDYSGLIDPAAALELLPQKINERKRQITSLVLDLQAFRESEAVDEADVAVVEKGIRANRQILSALEERYAAIKKALEGK